MKLPRNTIVQRMRDQYAEDSFIAVSARAFYGGRIFISTKRVIDPLMVMFSELDILQLTEDECVNELLNHEFTI